MGPREFRAAAARLADFIAEYWERVEGLPVRSAAAPGDVIRALPAHPPARGMPGDALTDAVLRDLRELILPALTHWQSPNFFAYFPANASFPAILGELLSAGLGVNGMLWSTSPAATELEVVVLDWFAEMLGVQPDFTSKGPGGGVIQGTASEATLTALVAARRRAVARGADPARVTAYASSQAHSSFVKACMVAGLAHGPDDRARVRPIDTDASGAMEPAPLRAAIDADLARGLAPCFVMATLGTTASGAIDPLDGVADAIAPTQSSGHGPWLHVDAAWAGSACVCPEFRAMLDGVARADSICVNPHKWLLTNFDCDCFYVRDRRALIDSMSVTPEYLRNPASDSGAVTDFRDWHVPLGRRFRALKLWMVIRAFGVEGLRAHVRESIRLASLFESWVRNDPGLELAAPRSLALVCFRARSRAGEDASSAEARSRRVLERANASGRVFLSHAAIPGPHRSFALRLAVGGTLTREHHVRSAYELLSRLAADDASNPAAPGA